MTGVAAFFDLDRTLIATSSASALMRPFRAAGLVTRRDIVRGIPAHAAFMVCGATSQQTERMRSLLAGIVRGWDVHQVNEIVRREMVRCIDPFIFTRVAAALWWHRQQGHQIVIASASPYELVEPIAAAVGAHHTLASRMQTRQGRYTGTVQTFLFGEAKATAMRHLADEQQYVLDRCYAYSDSITDVPMLSMVGHPVVVNPDAQLRRFARTHAWRMLPVAYPQTMSQRIIRLLGGTMQRRDVSPLTRLTQDS